MAIIMLPLFFVVLAAHSALSVPVYNGEQGYFNAIEDSSAPRSNINAPGSAITAFFERIDGGDRGAYSYLIEFTIEELENSNNPNAKFLSLLQALALFGEFTTSSAGSSCDWDSVINSYAQYVQSGNRGALNSALSTFSSVIGQRYQEISAYARDPERQRFAAPRSGKCERNWDFDTVWGGIIDNAASRGVAGPLNEQSCTGRRLYNAFRAHSNNIAAAMTASAIFGTSAGNVEQAIPALANFINNPASAQAASAAAQAISRAL